MRRPLLLDLYCGAGGCAKGYRKAEFDLIGVDKVAQPHYPYQFIQGDAIDLLPSLLEQYDIQAIHASPPCQVHSVLKLFADSSSLDLIPLTRDRLIQTRLPWVIENVPGAPLRDPIQLCGSSFDLGVRRHRLFESNLTLRPKACDHVRQNTLSPGYLTKRYHTPRKKYRYATVVGVYGGGQGMGTGEAALWRQAMGIDWMNRDEMAQAIPPAYTEYIGSQILLQIIAHRVNNTTPPWEN